MNKFLNVPFIKSRWFECGQACVAMMIKYYYSDFKPNFDEFNKIVKHRKGKFTFPLQNALLLNHYGIKAKCFCTDDYKTTKEDPNIFKKWYGKEYKQQIIFVDIKGYNWMCLEAKKKNLFKKRKTSLDDIIIFFKKGYLVCFVIDWKTLKDEKGDYEGHFVLLTGIKGNKIFIHDPDKGANIKYDRKVIEKAYNHPLITDDVFIAFGKKKSETQN